MPALTIAPTCGFRKPNATVRLSAFLPMAILLEILVMKTSE